MVELPGSRTVVVLTRAPAAGGKTRLFRELARAPDVSLLSALLLDTLDGAECPGVHRVVAVTPAAACASVASLAGNGIEVVPQGDGDLGARMAQAMSAAFASGASMVALIGSDIPHLTPAHVAAAFERLASDPTSIVLGPARDGGYYLIAAAAVPPVFEGIEWGSARVLEATRRRAAARGIPVQLIEPLADVDSIETLRAAVTSGRALRCAAWLGRLDGN